MRIVIVLPYSTDVPGGVGTHVFGEARWLASRGHDVHVIAPGVEPVDASVPVHLVGHGLGLDFNGSRARLAVWPHRIRRIAPLVRAADVVHVHEPLTPGLAFAAARWAPALVVTHHAAFTPPIPLGLLLRARARTLGSRVSLAVSPEAARTAYEATGVRPRVVPNALAPSPEPPAGDTPHRGGRRPCIAFLGRAADPRKGFTTFRAVAEQLGEEVSVVAMGPGTETSGGGLGVVSADRRREVLEGCDVLVAPHTGGESFGLVLLEALAAGCAVVASDIPAFRWTLEEALRRGVASLAEPHDVDGFVAAVRQQADRGPRAGLCHEMTTTWRWDAIGPALEGHLHAAAGRPMGSSTLEA